MRRSSKPAPAPDAPESALSPSSDESEGFASRWSRRKLAARQPATGSVPPEVSSASPATPTEAPEPPADADMPPIESLTEDSDVSGFFSPKVSEELRKLALRRLFHTSKFNVRDGLDDYDGDFRSFTPLGDVVTADMRHQFERQAELAERLLSPDSDREAQYRPAGAEAREGATTAQTASTGETPHAPDDDPEPDDYEVQS